MIAKLIPVILALVLSGPSSAQGTGDFASGPRKVFEYGPRPPLSVFDPGGSMDPAQVKAISDPLAAFYQKEGIDVIVVVVPELGNAPPEHVARSFASAWCKSPLHCVVLHVPGREDGPWIVPNGRLVEHLNPDQVQQAVNAGRRRAASEAKDADKVRAAANEAADMLRYWMANALNRSEIIRTESGRIRSELETRSRQRTMAAMLTAASVVPVIAGISLIIVFLRRRGARYFPQPASRPRLGAPYAGGNHAVVELGAPPP
ncbi:MAG: hypothetical protein RLZZ214_2364 [Verrucomicrobiota bacterium]|jgi:hypothetical protein